MVTVTVQKVRKVDKPLRQGFDLDALIGDLLDEPLRFLALRAIIHLCDDWPLAVAPQDDRRRRPISLLSSLDFGEQVLDAEQAAAQVG